MLNAHLIKKLTIFLVVKMIFLTCRIVLYVVFVIQITKYPELWWKMCGNLTDVFTQRAVCVLDLQNLYNFLNSIVPRK